ncbi:small nucleolar ribonucleoprotein complex component [Sporothrix brasiliensis 5110]|uniref:Small nucleolar ribonucleoprotein complex component n=1 Tax=Sporothrix brasiliensis 5110 TaxID=1398154 RepID=A0A0C2ETW1_9PEZI|nr:small nucleolar ribonucleoprotein complex component [Sporothrix brasiliensis 5110]KIH89964.1 small nucleolar ribonucleoprotein complex component [Sporothrix brasiliensis 5110]
MSSTKRKAPPVRIAQPQTTRNAKPMAKTRINEPRTAVVSVPKHQQKAKLAAGESIDISSDESDDEAADVDGDEDELMDDDAPVDAAADEPQTNGHKGTTNNEDDDENNDDDDDDEDHEPTFGDLVREHETVDVAAALSQLNPAEEPADANANGRAKTNTAVAAAPTLASLGHLLNAALRSGDDANLEVCFNTTTDAVWIRNTIQRLDPSLAGALLQKLAARIHRRPGRAHTLVGWVQWTLITHGGALLANQAGVTRALQELHRVLEERARGLNSLLLLKGKLDMLEAQMQLRRVQRAGAHAVAGGGGGHSGVATVGGRSGSSKALDGVNGLGRARGAGGRRRNGAGLGRGARDVDDDEEFVATYREEDDVEEEDEAGQILVNGAGAASESFIAESDEEALDDDDDDEDSEGDENDDAEDDDDLEEMDDDAAEEGEVDFDDVDDEDDDDEDEDEDDAAAAPPPKLQKKSGAAFSKRR